MNCWIMISEKFRQLYLRDGEKVVYLCVFDNKTSYTLNI